MPLLMDASTSTSPTDAFYVASQGYHKLLASIEAADGATVVFEERILGREWVPLADRNGAQLELSEAAPSAIVQLTAGQEIRCTRSSGSGDVSVLITRI